MKADEDTPQGACLDILERTTRRAVWPMVTSPAKKAAGVSQSIAALAMNHSIKCQSSNRSVSVARIARIQLGLPSIRRAETPSFLPNFSLQTSCGAGPT
jgi:hypothetical protein